MSELIDSPAEAEVNAALWMQVLGFHDADVTKISGDGGLDVLSSRAVAQVKLQFAPVGRPHLQNLVGAAVEHPGKMRLFFALKGYSAPAVTYAEQNGIALFSYSIDGNNIVPENTMAHHLYDVMLAQLPDPQSARQLPTQPVSAPVAPKQNFAAWFTPKRIKWSVLGVVALILVIFFAAHPAALEDVIFTLVVILIFGGWLSGALAPKKRRRAPARRRR